MRVDPNFAEQFALDIMVAALCDYDEDGHPQVQTDSPGVGGQAGTHPAAMIMPHGFHTRTLDPDKGPNADVGLGASVLCVTLGDARFAMPLADPRDQEKIPKLRKGGTMMSGGAGTYRSFITIGGLDPDGVQSAGSIEIFASYAKAGAKKSIGMSFNVRTPGAEAFAITHGEGQRFELTSDGAIVSTSADGGSWYSCSDDGHVLAGDTTIRGSCNVGGEAALPVVIAPLLVVMLQSLATLMANSSTAGTLSGLAGAPAIVSAFAKLIESQHLSST